MKPNLNNTLKTLFIIITLTLSVHQFQIVNAQVPDLPNLDSDTYFGQEWGVSGIAGSLLSYLNLGTEFINDKEVLASIELALEYVWNGRFVINDTKVSSWSKGPDNNNEFSIYPGKKYGAAGIIPNFIKMYKYTNNDIWLERSISSFWQLASEALNSSDFPNWAYTYTDPSDGGISLTDLKYGSTGVLSAALQLYEVTLNDTYLSYGNLILDWLNLMSVESIVNGISYSVIPWYNFGDLGYGPIKTGYEWGIAGMAVEIYKFGLAVNSPQYLSWALNLGDFLIAIQQSDGSWETDFNGGTKLTNFDEGVAGVVYGLNKLKTLSGSNRFDNAIISGINYLYSQYTEDSNQICFCETTETGSNVVNSLNRGILGVLKALVSVRNLLSESQLSILKFSYEWLLTQSSYIIIDGNDELLIFVTITSNDKIVDFSYGDGLSGLLSELVSIKKSNSSLDLLNVDVDRALNAVTNSLLAFQNIEGYWPRQRTLPVLATTKLDPESKNSNQNNGYFQIETMLFMPFVLAKIRQIKNNRKEKII